MGQHIQESIHLQNYCEYMFFREFVLDKLLSVYVCAEISFEGGVINYASTRDGQYTRTTICIAVNS
jgi:hypothetical protein